MQTDKMNSKVCVFPGSFNPFTKGHRHLIEKALKLYDKVIVAVAEETYKKNMRHFKIRGEITAKSLADLPSVEVKCFKGMLVDFLAEVNCFNIVRGVRNDEDMAYERNLEKIYKEMDSRVNFVIIQSELCDISSEKVRNAIKNNDSLDELICVNAKDDIIKFYK